jgi:hypothetical protein
MRLYAFCIRKIWQHLPINLCCSAHTFWVKKAILTNNNCKCKKNIGPYLFYGEGFIIYVPKKNFFVDKTFEKNEEIKFNWGAKGSFY